MTSVAVAGRADLTDAQWARLVPLLPHSAIDYRTPNEVESEWFDRNQTARDDQNFAVREVSGPSVDCRLGVCFLHQRHEFLCRYPVSGNGVP